MSAPPTAAVDDPARSGERSGDETTNCRLAAVAETRSADLGGDVAASATDGTLEGEGGGSESTPASPRDGGGGGDGAGIGDGEGSGHGDGLGGGVDKGSGGLGGGEGGGNGSRSVDFNAG